MLFITTVRDIADSLGNRKAPMRLQPITATSTAYHATHGPASWRGGAGRGERVDAGEDLDTFLAGPGANRFDDVERRHELTEHLRGLSLTGMGRESLEEVLAAEVPEERGWAAGEPLDTTVL